MYAISYVPSGGDFGNQECAFWQSYGKPFEFATYQEAADKINSIAYLRSLDGKVVSLRVAMQMTEEMVEVYSGRRKRDGYRRPVVNAVKPTYAKVMEHLKPQVHVARRFPVETPKPVYKPSVIVFDEN